MYTQDEKSTGLDTLDQSQLDQADLHIIGKVDDDGRAYAMTEDELEKHIANSVTFVDTLIDNDYFTTELANNENFINELTNNSLFQQNINNFVTGGGTGGSSNISEQFDDFVSIYQTSEGGSGTDQYRFSGNFAAGSMTISSEAEHPGIVNLSGISTLSGFYDFDINTFPGGNRLLRSDDDFDIEISSRLTYTGTFTASAQYTLAGVPNLTIDFTAGTGVVSVNSGTPTALPVPLTGVWFTVRFIRVGSSFNIYLNGQLAYTDAAFAVTGAMSIDITNSGSPLVTDVDYVRTMYRDLSDSNGDSLGINEETAIAYSGTDGDGDPTGAAPTNRQIMHDENTARIYTILDVDDGQTGDPISSVLRIFRNEFGTYALETEITFDSNDFTQTNPQFISPISWTKDDTYIYAVVGYGRSTGTDFSAIDVLRFDLDGSNMVVSNAFLSTNNDESDTTWNAFDTNGAIVIGSSLYHTYTDAGGVRKFLKYSISGTTYTLTDTYDVTTTGAGQLNLCRAISYDQNTSTFYFTSGDGQGAINKFTLISTTLTYGSDAIYDYLGYYSNAINNARIGYIADMTFQSTSMDLYMVYAIENDYDDGGGDHVSGLSHRVRRLRIPKF